MGFETFTKGMQDANEVLNRNFAAAETQLSSKAERYTKMITGDGIPQTVQEILALEPGIYSWVQSTALDWQPVDTPSGTMRVEFKNHCANGTGTRTYELAYTDGAANLRRYFGESGPEYTIRWTRMASSVSSNSYLFPFQNKFFGTLKYTKNQFGEVLLRGDIANRGGVAFTPDTDYIFGYLPEGYCPDDNIAAWIPCGMRSVSGSATIPSTVLIRPNGETSLHTPINVTTEAIICISAMFTAS